MNVESRLFLMDSMHPVGKEIAVRALYRIDPYDSGICRIIDGVGDEEAGVEEVRGGRSVLEESPD